VQATSSNISVTFSRSADDAFSSPSEASGKSRHRNKKSSGGGGVALAMVYAAKLGCYFIVQVPSFQRLLLCLLPS
jgi:hypothetical protein